MYSNFVPEQIHAVSAAIEASGRDMLYSLSPGDDNNDWARQIVGNVSMYRVTGDTWDRWDNIKSHFLSAQHMQPYIAYPQGRYGLPAWPDLGTPRSSASNSGRSPRTPLPGLLAHSRPLSLWPHACSSDMLPLSDPTCTSAHTRGSRRTE